MTALLKVSAIYTLMAISPFLSLGNSIESTDFIYPELDRQLTILWISADQKMHDRCETSISNLSREWAIISPELLETRLEHINMPDFVKRVNTYINALAPAIKDGHYSRLKAIAYHIMFEFRSLRQCIYKTEYSLDILWDSYDAYGRFKKTINDRMFDLREWFEFEDQVNDFICKWEYYDLRHIDEVHEYFPGISKAEHQALKAKVKLCIQNLLESIETGYQSNFVLPCDELGDALKDLLRLYSESRVVMLM